MLEYLTETVKGHFENDEFVFFWAGPFSNWHIKDSSFTMQFGPDYEDFVRFNCSEQAMMYIKAMYFNDEESMQKIMATDSPMEQKKLGRAVANYNENLWIEIREGISDEFLYEKFSQNDSLKKILLDTDNKIICESSPYDDQWGIGMGIDNVDILDRTKWKGLNLLGESLMRVRERIKREINEIE